MSACPVASHAPGGGRRPARRACGAPAAPRALPGRLVFALAFSLALLCGCVARTAPQATQAAPAAAAAPEAAGACPPAPGQAPSPQCAGDLRAVGAVVQALVAARNACDPAALLELYAEGAGIMTWLPGENRDAIVPRLRFAALLPAKAAGWRRGGRTHALAAPPAVAVAADTARAEFDLLVREGDLAATGHFALVLLRVDGQWRISRETYAQAE